MACLNSIEKLVAILGERVEVTTVAPSTIYLSLTLLRSATSGYDLRFFHYGLRILSQLLGESGKNVAALIANCEKTQRVYTENWSSAFEGIVPLLMPGLLTKIEEISDGTRDCLKLFLNADASGTVLDENDNVRYVGERASEASEPFEHPQGQPHVIFELHDFFLIFFLVGAMRAVIALIANHLYQQVLQNPYRTYELLVLERRHAAYREGCWACQELDLRREQEEWAACVPGQIFGGLQHERLLRADRALVSVEHEGV